MKVEKRAQQRIYRLDPQSMAEMEEWAGCARASVRINERQPSRRLAFIDWVILKPLPR